MDKFTFSRGLKLLAPIQFQSVFSQNQRANTPELSILSRPNEINQPRIGLTVAKKHLKKAHDRNRIKRIVRESFRLNQHQLPACDFVFIAKKGIGNLSNETLFLTLEKLWKRHIRLHRINKA